MDPAQAAVASKLLRAPKVIPMHFGTFPALTGRPDALAELTDSEVWTLEPGKPVEW